MSDRLHRVCTGSGRPALVFLHGLACALEDWAPQVDALSHEHLCVRLDLPGHGRSPLDTSPGVEMAAEAAASVVREEGVDDCVLIGHSWGCRVALQCAFLLGELVRGLVLVDGSRFASGDAERARAETLSRIESTGFEAFVHGMFSGMFNANSDPATRARIVERAGRLGPEAGTALLADLVAWDAGAMETVLDAVRVPVVVIQSTHIDESRQRVSLSAGDNTPWTQLVAERVAAARVEIIPGIGHFTMLEAPGEVSSSIARLCAGL